MRSSSDWYAPWLVCVAFTRESCNRGDSLDRGVSVGDSVDGSDWVGSSVAEGDGASVLAGDVVPVSLPVQPAVTRRNAMRIGYTRIVVITDKVVNLC